MHRLKKYIYITFFRRYQVVSSGFLVHNVPRGELAQIDQRFVGIGDFLYQGIGSFVGYIVVGDVRVRGRGRGTVGTAT